MSRFSRRGPGLVWIWLWWFAALALGLVALIALAARPAPAAERDQLGERLVDFHGHYDIFFRQYFGCPLRSADVSECRPSLGTRNYAEWAKSRAAAAVLYDLAERK